jgi:hypothetical protein
MWSHLPLAFVLASLFLCCGCLVAAWIQLRESREEAARLGQGSTSRTASSATPTCASKAGSRISPGASRSRRRSGAASVANQRLSAENRALAGGLRGRGYRSRP